jgi:hypothetical protein
VNDQNYLLIFEMVNPGYGTSSGKNVEWFGTESEMLDRIDEINGIALNIEGLHINVIEEIWAPAD